MKSTPVQEPLPSYLLKELICAMDISRHLTEIARQRNLAEVNFLRELRRVDQDAAKWLDWQRHINSGAEPFGE